MAIEKQLYEKLCAENPCTGQNEAECASGGQGGITLICKKVALKLLYVFLAVFLLPAAFLWIAGNGTKGKSIVEVWKSCISEFAVSKGVMNLAVGISLVLYFELFREIVERF